MQKTRVLFDAIRKKRLRTIIDFAIIVLIATIVFRNFLFSPEWPAGGDMMGYISREYLYGKDFKWLFVWRPNSFGYVEGINLMDLMFMITGFLAGNAVNTAKVFALTSFVLAGFAMYAFGYHYSKRHLAALAGCLIYILNQAYLTQLTEAHLDLMFSYALAPLVFLFLDRALETGKMTDIAASSFFFAVMLATFHPQAIMIYGSFLVLFLIINLVRPQGAQPSYRIIKRHLKSLVFIGVIAVALSSLVWVPLLFNVKALYLSTGFTRGSLEDTYTYGYRTIAEAFTLAGKESGGYIEIVDVTTSVGLQFLPVTIILLIIFSIAYVTTLIFKLNRYSIFFGLAALVSILISMGPFSPFEPSFSWAWLNIPYFQTFRAISRWSFMTAFANSFFICASVSILTGYILRVSHERRKDHTNTGTEVDNDLFMGRTPNGVSHYFERILSHARRFLYYFSILAIIMILLSGFISTWFLFSSGLQVWSPPANYVEPYEYLARTSGEYKIITVGRSQEDWLSASGKSTDFIGAMLTRIGWSHDLGYDSTFIHNKPVLQEGGLSSASLDFVNYLRTKLAGNNSTRNMLKMLGAFDYKYVVIPPYATQNQRDFFLSQYGGRVIYNQSDSIILENDFYNPRIFAPEQFAIVFGGSESVSSLYGLDSFDLSKTALISADRADSFQYVSQNLLGECASIIFSETDESDLTINPSDCVRPIYAADYGVSSVNVTKYWVSDSSTYSGAMVLGGRVLSTSGPNTKNFPFEVRVNGFHEILLRIGFAPNRGNLLVSVDGLPIAEVRPNANFSRGLRWVDLGSIQLETGSHSISLANDGSGFNDIDAIAVIEQSQLKTEKEKLANLLQTYNGSILYLIEAEKEFTTELPSLWSVLGYSGEGYALQIEGGLNISPIGSASASSVSDNLEPKYAIDGNPSSRWASSGGVPQWLQIEWPTPQELNGVGIAFEHAYAKDYQIQTWNGTDWIDQISIKDNELLARSHTFAKPVTTQKLRIFVTSAPTYNMVSIYELETYSAKNMTSSKIFVPKKGQYNFAARIFPNEEANATLFLKVDEKVFSISSSSEKRTIDWYVLGSATLDVGEHSIGLASSGKVVLDKIGIYLTKNETKSISEVLEPHSPDQAVQFEEINPCTYVVHLTSTKPFFLTFCESYHPMWKAYVDGQEISPVATNFVVNGYYINKTGSFDITIYFTGQTYAEAGLAISGISTAIIAVVAFVKCGPYEKLKRVLRRTSTRPKEEALPS